MNGGTLDLSGLTLKFDQIKANSNNVFITSSKAGVGGKIKCRKRKIKCRIFATNYLSFNLKLKL